MGLIPWDGGKEFGDPVRQNQLFNAFYDLRENLVQDIIPPSGKTLAEDLEELTELLSALRDQGLLYLFWNAFPEFKDASEMDIWPGMLPEFFGWCKDFRQDLAVESPPPLVHDAQIRGIARAQLFRTVFWMRLMLKGQQGPPTPLQAELIEFMRQGLRLGGLSAGYLGEYGSVPPPDRGAGFAGYASGQGGKGGGFSGGFGGGFGDDWDVDIHHAAAAQARNINTATGVRNAGNTCYFNSLLNFLRASGIFTRRLLDGEQQFLAEDPSANVHEQRIAQILLLIHRNDLATALERYNQYFDELAKLTTRQHPLYPYRAGLHVQQDAMEFFVRNIINEESVPRLGPIAQQSFGHTLNASTECQNCGYTRTDSQPCYTLGLSLFPLYAPKNIDSIVATRQMTLVELMVKDYAMPTYSELTCPTCGVVSFDAVQRQTFTCANDRDVVVVIGRRREQEGAGHIVNKDERVVTFDQRPFIVPIFDKATGRHRFWIVKAVLHHIGGGQTSGHFVVDVRDGWDQPWYRFNDSLKYRVSVDKVQAGTATVLLLQEWFPSAYQPPGGSTALIELGGPSHDMLSVMRKEGRLDRVSGERDFPNKLVRAIVAELIEIFADLGATVATTWRKRETTAVEVRQVQQESTVAGGDQVEQAQDGPEQDWEDEDTSVVGLKSWLTPADWRVILPALDSRGIPNLRSLPTSYRHWFRPNQAEYEKVLRDAVREVLLELWPKEGTITAARQIGSLGRLFEFDSIRAIIDRAVHTSTIGVREYIEATTARVLQKMRELHQAQVDEAAKAAGGGATEGEGGQSGPSGGQGDPSGGQGDPSGAQGDPSGAQGDPSGAQGDALGGEGNALGGDGNAQDPPPDPTTSGGSPQRGRGLERGSTSTGAEGQGGVVDEGRTRSRDAMPPPPLPPRGQQGRDPSRASDTGMSEASTSGLFPTLSGGTSGRPTPLDAHMHDDSRAPSALLRASPFSPDPADQSGESSRAGTGHPPSSPPLPDADEDEPASQMPNIPGRRPSAAAEALRRAEQGGQGTEVQFDHPIDLGPDMLPFDERASTYTEQNPRIDIEERSSSPQVPDPAGAATTTPRPTSRSRFTTWTANAARRVLPHLPHRATLTPSSVRSKLQKKFSSGSMQTAPSEAESRPTGTVGGMPGRLPSSISMFSPPGHAPTTFDGLRSTVSMTTLPGGQEVAATYQPTGLAASSRGSSASRAPGASTTSLTRTPTGTSNPDNSTATRPTAPLPQRENEGVASTATTTAELFRNLQNQRRGLVTPGTFQPPAPREDSQTLTLSAPGGTRAVTPPPHRPLSTVVEMSPDTTTTTRPNIITTTTARRNTATTTGGQPFTASQIAEYGRNQYAEGERRRREQNDAIEARRLEAELQGRRPSGSDTSSRRGERRGRSGGRRS
ncbi:Ubiquitin carboxyl-terminal hydrolase 25 [Elasticomyces elasticus]|nr:Ubiquitin carboxyl-terminal hydrolase 25 [Elasticomyces elasticus]KAK3667435.1 Ubiquitin carboxyl-terminal hydrolase 25 [Elasticomyces elasticus]KAK4915209.1 Ubiquitin carboxyl-terminal hydrolase 25 [Elasticomyces elasticus]KAK5760496.1 Ubiquitin carboxyl-terminal hydrolase 25 [Elasticomyces elasticus]